MKPIRKELNGITFEWNPTLYGKGGWMSIGKTGKLSPARKVDSESLGNPTDDQLKSHNIEKPEPKEKDVTERIKDEIYIWKPEAMSGKGAWYVLGTRGGLVRTAGIAESKKLNNIMKNKEKNKKNKEKESKAKDQKENVSETVSGNSDEPKEPQETEPKEVLQNSSNNRSDKYRERDAEYYQAARVRKTGVASLIAKHLSSGEGFGASIKGALGDKFKARMSGIKEKFDIRKKFDFINIGKAIGGNLGAAIMGRLTGRSTEDMNYFTGLRAKSKVGTATLQQRLEPTLQSETTNRDPMHSKVSDNSRARVKKGDSLADVLTKLYNLIKRISDDDIKRLELDKNFTKEKDAEKLKFLENLATLLGKSKEPTTKKVEEKKNSALEDTVEGILKILSEIVEFIRADKIASKLASVVRSAMPLIGTALLSALPAAILAAPALMAGANKDEIDADPNNSKFDGIPYAEKVRKNLKEGVDASEGGLGGQQGLKQRAETARGTDQYSPEVQQALKAAEQQILDDTELRGGIPAEKLPKRKNTKLKAGEFKDDMPVEDSNDLEPENQSGKDIPVTTAKPIATSEEPKPTASKVSKNTKNGLTEKQQKAFDLLNKESKEKGYEEYTDAELNDPKQREDILGKIRSMGLAYGFDTNEEDSKTTQLKQENPYGEKVQSSIQNFNEAQRNAITTPTVMNVDNSKVIGSGGGGEVRVTLSKNAVVRNDETTLRTCQYQSLRLVH